MPCYCVFISFTSIDVYKDHNIILWFDCLNYRMPGGASKGKVKKHFKAKHQKKRVFRSSDPILSVFMWGVNHTVSV